MIGSEVSNKLSSFARWVKGEYNVTADQDTVVYEQSEYSVKLMDGSDFFLCGYEDSFKPLKFEGTVINKLHPSYTFATGYSFRYKDSVVNLLSRTGEVIMTFSLSNNIKEIGLCRRVSSNGGFYISAVAVLEDGRAILVGSPVTDYCGIADGYDMNLSFVHSSQITIPDTVPADKEVVIRTGAAAATSYDDALAQILDAIAVGEFSATKEITDAGAITDDPAIPIEETIPDVSTLGLPALGETLTTRFPFSIPWDVVRAIRLLAAPAKTPRFEVDFMAPIRYRFGGNLGDTTVVLDFSKYEIIGEVSRWASTIGFCLLLASGTKKLIWTA